MKDGELVELEESVLYGLWDGHEWWRDADAVVFHTPYKRVALATTLFLDHMFDECSWAVLPIGLDGWPVGMRLSDSHVECLKIEAVRAE